MKTLLFLLLATVVGLVSSFAESDFALLGKEKRLELSSLQVKSISRVLTAGGKKQTWNVSGPNKNTWVDESGKKIDSSNYAFKAPGTLIIKKTGKADDGLYDFDLLVALPPPPKGVHVDPHPQGLQLNVIEKL